MGAQVVVGYGEGVLALQAQGWPKLANGRACVKVKGEWKYLYRAVDKTGDTIDYLLWAHRDKAAARRFFEQVIDRGMHR